MSEATEEKTILELVVPQASPELASMLLLRNEANIRFVEGYIAGIFKDSINDPKETIKLLKRWVVLQTMSMTFEEIFQGVAKEVTSGEGNIPSKKEEKKKSNK